MLPWPEVSVDLTDSVRRERAVIVTVALTTMLAPLNSTMIAVALPGILAEFAIPIAAGGWLVTAYLLAMATLQPIAGKLGDRLGRRHLILAGLVYFGLVSLGATFAPTFLILLALRVQQAIACALIVPNGTALIREIVPAERRAGRSGLIGSAIAFAAAGGPPIGGILVSLAGWRAIFFVNLLLIVPALVLAVRFIPSPKYQRTEARASFDVLGALGLFAVLLGTAGLLTQSRQINGVALLVAGLALIGVLLLFLRRELRHPDPVFQPRFFLIRVFAAANAAIGLSNLAMYSILVAVPFVLGQRPGWTTAGIGLALGLLSAAMVVISPFGGRLGDLWGRRWPTVLGLAVFAIGVIPFAIFSAAIEIPALLAGLTIAGVGLVFPRPACRPRRSKLSKLATPASPPASGRQAATSAASSARASSPA